MYKSERDSIIYFIPLSYEKDKIICKISLSAL